MSELFDPQKLVTIAENQQKVFDAGFAAGAATGTQFYHGRTQAIGGTLTTDELPFKPRMITIWNIQKRDMMEDPEWDPEEYWIRYFHTGIMLTAICLEDGTWVSQGMAADSSGAFIANETADGGTGDFWDDRASSSGIRKLDDNVYEFKIYRNEVWDAWADEEYEYVAYGAI